MVQLVENQPDAYTYRLFGKRVLLGCLLAAMILVLMALLMTVVILIINLIGFLMSYGNYPTEGVGVIRIGFMLFLMVGFLPLVWITMLIVRIFRKWYKRLGLEKSGPVGLITIARIQLLLMSALVITPLAIFISDPFSGFSSVTNFYTNWFLQIFFTLLGSAILLLFLAPVLTIHKRTKGRGLYLAGVLVVIAGGLIIFFANAVWSIGVTEISYARTSFVAQDNVYWSDQGSAGTFDEGDSLWIDKNDNGIYDSEDEIQDIVLRGNPISAFTRGQEIVTGDDFPFIYDATDECGGACTPASKVPGTIRYQDGQDIYETENLDSFSFSTGGSNTLVDADGSQTPGTGDTTSDSTGSQLTTFLYTYWMVMLSVAGLLFLAGLIMRRNAGSILRHQRGLFVTRLEG